MIFKIFKKLKYYQLVVYNWKITLSNIARKIKHESFVLPIFNRVSNK